MRFLAKTWTVALSAGLAFGMTASAYGNGSAHPTQPKADKRAHAKAAAPVHRHMHVSVRAKTATAPYPYAYGYVPDYAYYVPTRVFRCYAARQMVEDQVGLVVGYVPLGTCG
jgi:hypothetical protein